MSQTSETLSVECGIALCRERNPGSNAVCLGYYDPPKGQKVDVFWRTHPVEVNDRIFAYKCNICGYLFGLAEPNYHVLMYQHKKLEHQQDDLGVFNPI